MNYWICLINWLTSGVKTLSICVSVLLLSVSAWSADFGVAVWGMSRDEVRQLENRTNLTPFNVQDYLIYELQMNGIDHARIVYQFADNGLAEGRFLFFPASQLDVFSAVENYQKIKTMMTGQYGPPNVDEVITANPDEMLVAPESIANELASDRVILKTSWRSQTAVMHHQLAWNQTKPHHQLHYVPTLPQQAMPSGEAF